jgi:hypothetical protein
MQSHGKVKFKVQSGALIKKKEQFFDYFWRRICITVKSSLDIKAQVFQ